MALDRTNDQEERLQADRIRRLEEARQQIEVVGRRLIDAASAAGPPWAAARQARQDLEAILAALS